MSPYTITITPDDSTAAAASIVVEVGPGGVRVGSVTVRPGADGAPLPPELLALDLGVVSEALGLLSPGVKPAAEPVAAPAPEDHGRGADVPAEARRSRPVGDMPSDLGTVYWRLGTVGKIADHYDVPRHIARNWIKNLRESGGTPNPWRRQAEQH